ncbi:DUF6338 family protein [Microbacterium sp. EST19A]|uniref:DUF6338 family protein n=1 Tax=Microbacterium sp. EST19A TaxID=2862681 RepID=UPI001CBFF1B1|nr:DUF6338 family protein [Microbacterium sp. EST19A]
MPTDGLGILSYLALIVPGVIFILVRSQLRGFRDVDRSVGSRILLAFIVSVIFDAVYIAVLGPPVIARLRSGEAIAPAEVSVAAWLFLLMGIVIPALLSYVVYGGGRALQPLHRLASRMRSHLTDSRYEATPTAWDLAATTTEAGWVRIRIADGVWIGGRFGDQSYFSTYPEPRDIFIETQYMMDQMGAFNDPVEGSAGVWVAVRDDYIVEWLYDAEDRLESDVRKQAG